MRRLMIARSCSRITRSRSGMRRCFARVVSRPLSVSRHVQSGAGARQSGLGTGSPIRSLGRRGAVTIAALLGVAAVPLYTLAMSGTTMWVGAVVMGICGIGIWGMAPTYLTRALSHHRPRRRSRPRLPRGRGDRIDYADGHRAAAAASDGVGHGDGLGDCGGWRDRRRGDLARSRDARSRVQPRLNGWNGSIRFPERHRSIDDCEAPRPRLFTFCARDPKRVQPFHARRQRLKRGERLPVGFQHAQRGRVDTGFRRSCENRRALVRPAS